MKFPEFWPAVEYTFIRISGGAYSPSPSFGSIIYHRSNRDGDALLFLGCQFLIELILT